MLRLRRYIAVLVGHSDNVVRENFSSGRAGISLEKGHQQQQLERVHVYTLQCLLQATNHRFTSIRRRHRHKALSERVGARLLRQQE